MIILMYLITGVISGLIGGLLGIGGGSIVVPSLVFIYTYLSFPKESIMHIAIGTSLATTMINSLISAYLHNKSKGVAFPFLRHIILGTFFGALLGSFIATILSSRWLEIIFAFFAFGIAIRFFRPILKKNSSPYPLSPMQITISGLIIAVIANLVGVGGGIFMIPFLTFCCFPSEKIIGTSASVSFLISFFGVSFFLLKGNYTYINFTSLLWITIGSLFSIHYGVRLAKTLSYSIISKIFATLMLLTAIIMFMGR